MRVRKNHVGGTVSRRGNLVGRTSGDHGRRGFPGRVHADENSEAEHDDGEKNGKRTKHLWLQTREGDGGEKKPLQAQFPARRIVPFVQSVRAVGFAPPAEGNRGDAERQRNIRVGGTVLEAGAHAEKTVNATNGIEQRRIFGELTCGADAERARSQLQRHAGVSRAGHFFFYAGLHRFAQRRLHFGHFGLVLGAQINLDDGARGNRIHGRAAFDDPKIVRAAGIFRNAQGGKFDDAAGKRGDRIRRAEIRPTVAAGAGDRNFKTMRRDTLGGDVLGGGAIHRDDRAQARAIFFDQRANAAQIAFAFFAHVARENDGLIGAHAAFGKRSRDGDESCETRAVIGNARAGETIAIFFHAHVGISGKNSVEMRGEKNDAVGVGAGPLADYVSGLVGVNLQAKGFEKLLQELAALGFAKFRSGNFAERNLLVGHPFGVFVEPNESLRASGFVRDFFDGIGGGARRDGGHHKNDTADGNEFHGFRAENFSANCGANGGGVYGM